MDGVALVSLVNGIACRLLLLWKSNPIAPFRGRLGHRARLDLSTMHFPQHPRRCTCSLSFFYSQPIDVEWRYCRSNSRYVSRTTSQLSGYFSFSRIIQCVFLMASLVFYMRIALLSSDEDRQSVFCDDCLANQTTWTRLLAEYLPDESVFSPFFFYVYSCLSHDSIQSIRNMCKVSMRTKKT